MLEVLMNNPSDRKGEAKIDTSAAYNGSFCYIKGFDANGFTLLDLAASSATAARALYPINKFYYPEDLSDTSDSVDKRKKGDTVIYYTGEGEYITDQWVPSSFGFDAAYWNALEGGLAASAFGAKIVSPGTNTAQGTVSLGQYKCWVSTGLFHGGFGKLIGTSQAVGGGTVPAQTSYVARVIQVFGADSADAKIRIRLENNPKIT